MENDLAAARMAHRDMVEAADTGEPGPETTNRIWTARTLVGRAAMRVVEKASDFAARLDEARQESAGAFGSDAVFLERYIRRAKHVEVQILGDHHGNLLHLH